MKREYCYNHAAETKLVQLVIPQSFTGDHCSVTSGSKPIHSCTGHARRLRGFDRCMITTGTLLFTSGATGHGWTGSGISAVSIAAERSTGASGNMRCCQVASSCSRYVKLRVRRNLPLHAAAPLACLGRSPVSAVLIKSEPSPPDGQDDVETLRMAVSTVSL